MTYFRYWDLDLIEWRKICEVDCCSDVVQYVSASMSPHPHRDYCLFRSWRELPGGRCALYIVSTRHQHVSPVLLVPELYCSRYFSPETGRIHSADKIINSFNNVVSFSRVR